MLAWLVESTDHVWQSTVCKESPGWWLCRSFPFRCLLRKEPRWRRTFWRRRPSAESVCFPLATTPPPWRQSLLSLSGLVLSPNASRRKTWSRKLTALHVSPSSDGLKRDVKWEEKQKGKNRLRAELSCSLCTHMARSDERPETCWSPRTYISGPQNICGEREGKRICPVDWR